MGPKRRGPSPDPYRHAGGRTCRAEAVALLLTLLGLMAGLVVVAWQVIGA